MTVTGEAICSSAGTIAPAVNMLDKVLNLGKVVIFVVNVFR